MRYIRPLLLRSKYFSAIEDEINRLFARLIYQPLASVLFTPTDEIVNTGGALLQAVRDGTVWWDDGQFKGHFNARITRDLKAIGATYNARAKTFSLTRELIPTDIRFAQAWADERYDKLRQGFLRTLDDINLGSIPDLSRTQQLYDQSLGVMEEDFQKALGAISVPVQLTAQARKLISREWGQNLDKYIQTWTGDNILKLRGEVQANAFAGRRSHDLVQLLKSNYGVSLRKAKFLARQETSLLLSKFRQTRYLDAGLKYYKWSTSHDERVRSDHRELNGQIFTWDNPPVTDKRTAARNHPGEDFGCRCVAIAILK